MIKDIPNKPEIGVDRIISLAVLKIPTVSGFPSQRVIACVRLAELFVELFDRQLIENWW
jgi:hypothetical protein